MMDTLTDPKRLLDQSAMSGVQVAGVWLPESIEYLATRRPANALQRINKTLQKIGHGPLARLPGQVPDRSKTSYQRLFSAEFRALTLLMILSFFMLIMTFYYILKWIPKIVVDMGCEAASAGAVLVWANVGGATGAVSAGTGN